MIVGEGDIAKALKPVDRKNWIFFASGVSNSQETREDQYQMEKNLLLGQLRCFHIVYFSSLSIFYSDTRYARHKREMEELVKAGFLHYTIVRLGNIKWGRNPNTIINFLKNRKKKGKKLEIRNEYRYIVEKNEFLHWMKLIPEFNVEMNIPGRRMKVKEIVNKYV